eukprot:SAG31_NODE_32_length_32319_cov_28.042681_2_plen_410_part_00
MDSDHKQQKRVISLPAELVVAVLHFAPLSTILCGARVCRAFRDASRTEEIAQAVLLRQWQLPKQLLGDGSCGAWWHLLRSLICLEQNFNLASGIARALLDVDMAPQALESSDCIPVGIDMIEDFSDLGARVQEFVIGIMLGFMPTDDGLFTFHAKEATPIHYKHVLDYDTQPQLARLLAGGDCVRCRLGGRWLWSADRLNWHPTTITELDMATGSLFARPGWRLVPDNEALVRLFQRYPILPLFPSQMNVCENSLDRELWASAHAGVAMQNHGKIARFIDCLSTFNPTTPCVTTHQLTVHQLMRPPIVIKLGSTRNGEYTYVEDPRCVEKGISLPSSCYLVDQGTCPPQTISNEIPLVLGQFLANGQLEMLVTHPNGTQTKEHGAIWELLCWRHSRILTEVMGTNLIQN